ncbi:VOC family protein [Kitasatospora terrestris]|uniref:4-hydroxyphenylpyruvate dioxygenase n=1 Tax=Kitasatospora terrestris TaxID=258051 RepID=A0ABP9E9I7_9ACTN
MTTVQGLAHVELHVEDAHKYATGLHDHLGFTLTAPAAVRPGTAQVIAHQGAVRHLITSAVDPEHPVADWVRRHGDGVAVLVLRSADPAASVERAVAAGAVELDEHTVLGALGDLALRFTAADDLLPDGEPAAEGPLFELDHLALCVPAGTLGPAVRFAREGLGLAEVYAEYIEVGDQAMDSAVVQSPDGSVTLTLLEPDVRRSPGQIDGFLEAHGGAGVQHLAYGTRSITAAVRELADRGVVFLTTPGAYYDRLAARLGPTAIPVEELRAHHVLVDRDHGGELFQIFTRSTHPRRTLFLELVERRGAGTFGSANIKALYEAVERERAGQEG